MISLAVSLVLVEADDVGIVPEASSADVHVIFSDQALAGGADPAGTAVLAVGAGVGAPEQVRHACGNYNTEYYLLNSQSIFLERAAQPPPKSICELQYERQYESQKMDTKRSRRTSSMLGRACGSLCRQLFRNS